MYDLPDSATMFVLCVIGALLVGELSVAGYLVYLAGRFLCHLIR